MVTERALVTVRVLHFKCFDITGLFSQLILKCEYALLCLRIDDPICRVIEMQCCTSNVACSLSCIGCEALCIVRAGGPRSALNSNDFTEVYPRSTYSVDADRRLIIVSSGRAHPFGFVFR